MFDTAKSEPDEFDSELNTNDAGPDENLDVPSKYAWTDITEQFKTACKSLKLGELWHDSHFSLMEGMSAIEMMDPKMDAGMLCNQSKRKLISLRQAIKDGEIKIENLTAEALIGIIDDTLACFVTWIEGHSLAQTVFINLYLHDPALINDPTLKSFSTAILKIVDDVRDKITRVSVYEEEDFQSMSYNFNMADEVADQFVLSMLRDVEEDYNKVVKSTRSRTGVEQTQDDINKNTVSQALASRLKFTRLFYSLMLMFNREKSGGMADGEKLLKQMSELLATIKSTLHLGSYASQQQHHQHETQPQQQQNSSLQQQQQLQQNSSHSHTQQQHTSPSQRSFAPGFEPMANQRLLPPTFPRLVLIRSRSESVEYFQQLVLQLQHIISVASLNNFHEIIDFCLEFSKPSPCLLSRSILQLMILPINKRIFGEVVMDIIRETIRSFCAPPALIKGNPLYNNCQLKECVDTFLVHCVRPIINIVQTTGHNRARMRDRWARVAEDLALLQEEAEKLDSYMQTLMMKMDTNYRVGSYFGTWVLYLTLRVMILYVTSGLELELYSPHEYNYVFWYLSEGLYNWLTSTISRAEVYAHEAESMTSAANNANNSGKGTKKTKKSKKKVKLPSNELVVSQALHCLTGGYYKSVIALRMDNKLSLPKFDFDSEEVRYNHRFSPFAFIMAPPLLQYQQFKEHTDVKSCDPVATSLDLYKGASKCFNQTKLHLESIPNPNEEVQSLLKVAKTNLVVMRILEGGHKMDLKKLPEFNFEHHKLFPIIKLT
ncbi:hypothetical protein HELRODRAFT_194114 [Helobdella robusta]|uniref:Protein MAK10 homolog n=1 Tax=Helobdella robusta TaxID=6412 RepID=T1FVP7_HELRO|nr:hypothetical protein HELRODRAFT_194114 [Helobdella robusta]ESN93288.1 hypothetical protein HELRODRAFT_194114 [Helobdella robusta]